MNKSPISFVKQDTAYGASRRVYLNNSDLENL